MRAHTGVILLCYKIGIDSKEVQINSLHESFTHEIGFNALARACTLYTSFLKNDIWKYGSYNINE